MAEKKEQSPPNNSASMWVHQDEPSEIYVNTVQIAVGMYDFLLEFGVNYPDGKAVKLARIRMTPQHAWVMSHVLQGTVKAYIEQIGSFELPEKFLEEKNLTDAFNAEVRKTKRNE